MNDDPFDAEGWLGEFRQASKKRDRHRLRTLRADIFEETVRIVRAAGYSVDGHKIALDSAGEYDELHRGTVYYSETDTLVIDERRKGRFKTDVQVIERDCLEVAHDLCRRQEVPAVLNMASRRNPGGGARSGAGAQEENLFRRTNLLRSLYQFAPYASDYGVPANAGPQRYPIPRESGGIYSPPAWVFRSSEAEGYRLLADPFQAAFLTIPAINRPDTIDSLGTPRLTDEMAAATERKVRAILRVGATHEHDALVLGAHGCGAFRNPPEHVAEIFRKVLEEEEFVGVFRSIVFAILDDHNSALEHNPHGNYRPFHEILVGPL